MAVFVTSAIIIFAMMTILFFRAQSSKNFGIVDNYWGVGFILIALVCFLLGENQGIRGLLVTILVVAWGLRLSLYLRKRNAGKPEDFRYAAMRAKWTRRTGLHAFFKIFMLQGVLMLLISLPIFVISWADPGTPLSLPDLIGLIIWGTGFYFQARGDAQLAKFKSDPANSGKIMTTGLWAKTRHPNYFGEILMWWGIFVISLSAGGWYLSIIGPVLITLLITKVSGVPMLEKKYEDDPAFKEYAAKTPALFPRFF